MDFPNDASTSTEDVDVNYERNYVRLVTNAGSESEPSTVLIHDYSAVSRVKMQIH